MLCNADFRTDDKFLCIGSLCIVHDARGGTDIICFLGDSRNTFRMNQQKCLRMQCTSFIHSSLRNSGMNRATALQQLDFLVWNLLSHILTQIAVRNKQNFICFHVVDNLDCGRRGYADITDGFQIRGGVDICHNGIARICLLPCTDQFLVHLLCHRTSCNRVSQIYGLFRGKNLYGFCHKTNAAHDNVFLRCGSSLHTEAIGIADKVCNFRNFSGYIAVCQNTYILFLFQAQDFILNLTNHMSFLLIEM